VRHQTQSPSSSSSTLRSRNGAKAKATDDDAGLLVGIVIGASTGAFILFVVVKSFAFYGLLTPAMKILSRDVATKLDSILSVCRLSVDVARHDFVVKST
jgi:hypothetical protein